MTFLSWSRSPVLEASLLSRLCTGRCLSLSLSRCVTFPIPLWRRFPFPLSGSTGGRSCAILLLQHPWVLSETWIPAPWCLLQRERWWHCSGNKYSFCLHDTMNIPFPISSGAKARGCYLFQTSVSLVPAKRVGCNNDFRMEGRLAACVAAVVVVVAAKWGKRLVCILLLHLLSLWQTNNNTRVYRKQGSADECVRSTEVWCDLCLFVCFCLVTFRSP